MPYIIDPDFETLDLFNYGIYAIVPTHILPRLYTGKLLVTRLSEKDQDTMIIVTGSIEDWIISIRKNCTSNADEDTRLFYNKCLICFEQTPWKQIFKCSKKQYGSTFLIEDKT